MRREKLSLGVVRSDDLFSLLLVVLPARRCYISVCGTCCYFTTSFSCVKNSALQGAAVVGASNRDGTPTRFCNVRVSRRASSSQFLPLVVGRVLAAFVEVVADPPPLACVSAFASNFGSFFLRWFHALAGFDDLHHMVDNPGDFLEFPVYDPGSSPSATSTIRMTRRWPSNATIRFAEVKCVGCSDPLSCTVAERDVGHGDTVRRRSATSMTEACVLPSVMAAALLKLAQNQERAAFAGISQQWPPGPVIPGERGKSTFCGNSRSDSEWLHSSWSTCPLARVDVLEQRMSAHRSLGGLLAVNIAKCAENKCRKREGASCRRRRGRGSEVRSGSSSSTDEGVAFGLFPPCDGIRIQITSERKTEKSLASELQQIKQLLAHRGRQAARLTVASWPLVFCNIWRVRFVVSIHSLR